MSGLDNVITTVTLPMEAFIKVLKNEVPGISTVYDEILSYETAVKKFRKDNKLKDEKKTPFPLFAFKRSILRHASQAPARRARLTIFKQLKIEGESFKADRYKVVHGEYDIDFHFYTPNVALLEQFEIAYLAEEGITSVKELSVTLPKEITLDDGSPCTMPFFVTHEDLEAKEFVSDETYHKFISGTITVRGFYFVFQGTSSLITSIQSTIRDLLGPSVIYCEQTIEES